nr:cytochrome c oxidase subunit 2 [Penenirmus auritus]
MIYTLLMPDSWSPIMYEMNSFHDHAMVVVLGISTLVFQIFSFVLAGKQYTRTVKSAEGLEVLWTVLPCIILLGLASPSLITLYLSDEVVNPLLTIKVIGHQWYWSYEWADFCGLEIDSFMKSSSSLESGESRLLEVDECVVIPIGQEVRLVVTSSDVIHSWTIPSAGLKVDAVPGRINQLSLIPNRVGKMFGQCSEICGSLHSFMPICVEVVTEQEFMSILS